MSDGQFTFTPEERGFENVKDDDSDALYATDESRDATGRVASERFAARGSEQTGFYAQKVQRDESGKIVGKQTFGTKKDSREEAVESIEKQVRNRTAAGFGGFQIGEFTVGDDSDIALARRAHLARPEEAQASDAGKRAPVTTNASRYASQPGELDYPGVDTPKTNPNVLPKDLRQKQRPATTDPPERPTRQTEPPETPTVERNTQAPEPLTTGLARQDVSLSPEEAFEGVGSGSSEGAFFGTGSRVDEQRRLESGDPPDSALADQGSDKKTLSNASDEALNAGVAVAGFGSDQFDATDTETPDPFALGGTTQAPLSAATVTDDDPANALGDSTVDTLRETVDYLETEYGGDPQEELDGFGEFATAVRTEAQVRGDER